MSPNSLFNIAKSYFRSISTIDNSFSEKKEIQAPSDPLHFTTEEQDKTLFASILPYSKNVDKELLQDYNTTLSSTGVNDLHLLSGTKSNPQASILNKISHTQTRTGKCIKAIMLASPTKRITTLQERQDSIKALRKADVGKRADDILAKYKQSEASVLSFYREEDPLKHPAYRKNIDSFYFKKLGLDRFNTSSIALRFRKIAKDYWLHLGLGFWITFSFIYNLITRGYIPVGVEKVSKTVIWSKMPLGKLLYSTFKSLVFNDMIFPGLGLYGNFNQWKQLWYTSATGKLFLLKNMLGIILTLIFLLLGCFFWYYAIKKFQRYQKTLQYLAERLRAFQKLIHSTEDMLIYFKENSQLKVFSPQKFPSLHQLVSSDTDEANQLIYNLKTLPLDEWTYFLSPHGKLLTTYLLLQKHSYIFSEFIYGLGKLDALRSTALHMEATQRYSPQKHYTFTTFIDKSNVPILEQKGLWHLLLDAKSVVTNELNMSGTQGGLRTMLITGPNGGGKSTYIHAVTINLVLSQTFGIAACGANRQTIFHKIITYFDIMQDLTAGLSFFQAKVKVLKELAQALAACPKGEYIFCMLDEPLSGTSESASSEAGYNIIEQFHTKCSQALFIIVTHLAKLTKLASYEGCENRKVYVEKKHKKIIYTYKIVPGIADQNVAIDILKEEGLISS